MTGLGSATSSGRVLLQSADATGVAAVEFLDFVDAKKYSSYELDFNTGSRGAGNYNYWYISLSGDATAPVWIGAGYYDQGHRLAAGTNVQETQATDNAAQWSIMMRGSWPNGICRGLLEFNFINRPVFKGVTFDYYADGGTWSGQDERGWLDSATAIKSMKIALSGGPVWPSGTFNLFGIPGEV